MVRDESIIAIIRTNQSRRPRTHWLWRVEAPPSSDENRLLCLSCGAPLLNREGKYALKYFRTNGKPVQVRNSRQPKLTPGLPWALVHSLSFDPFQHPRNLPRTPLK